MTSNPNGHPDAEGAPDKSAPVNRASPWLLFGISVFLALIVWTVFGQVRNFQFLNMDDHHYVYGNPDVTAGVTAKGIALAFSPNETDNWVPLTTISHMVDCQFYGLNAGDHHLTNVLLHGTSAILLFLVLARMTGAVWRSAFVAAVFAVHPLRAESVCWVSERKDVLCGVFFMLTLWAYARYVEEEKRKKEKGKSQRLVTSSPALYLVTLFFAACALMSKPVAVTMPFVLLLLDYWPLTRFNRAPWWRLIMEKIPFLVLSLGSCFPTVHSETPGIVMLQVPMPLRIENALVSCVAYIRELFYPAGLAAFYPYPIQGIPFATVAGAFLLLAAITLGVFYLRKRHPYLLVGWLWYLGMLVPVIGLVQVGSQSRADRHTYFSEIGLCFLVTWLIADVSARLRHRILGLAGISSAILAVLIYCCHTQTAYWRNNITVWSHAITCTSYNVMAYCNLGHALLTDKNWDGAIQQYKQAIKYDPTYAEAYNNLGIAVAGKGQTNEAVLLYRQAIKMDPTYALAYYNLGSALFQKGETDEAIANYQDAIKIDPHHIAARNHPSSVLPSVAAGILASDYAQFHNALGIALAKKGDIYGAITQYQDAVALDAGYAEAACNLANALLNTGQVDKAIAAFQAALKIGPGDAKAHNNLGTALRKEGKMDEAIGQYQESLKIDPGYAPAHYNLGNALLQQGQVNDAIVEYESALKLKPDNAMVQNNLAHTIWMLATSPDAPVRNGTNAVAFAQRANQLADGTNPLILRVLAAAQAESGHFPEAIETAKAALTLATQEQNFPLQNALQQEISQYQASSPVRADPTDMTGWQ